MEQKVHYRALGLVNTRGMFTKAMAGKYAIPAYNFNNLEQLQAIVIACVETNSPVILQVSKGARSYANEIILPFMVKGAVQMAREMGSSIPISMHLDHGDSLELAIACIDSGFSSVMIDGSHLPYGENVALAKKVVEYARLSEVSVEAELGVLAGIEDDVSAEHSTYTNPEEVADFVQKTGVDSLAISIGTSHGAYKFKPRPGETLPPLRFDILAECERLLPGFPIVLHGASTIPQEYVQLINAYGGEMADACGIPEEQLRKAAAGAVCKINIDSDGRLAITARIREYFAREPKEFDPRKYMGEARKELIKLIKQKNEAVLGSAGKG